MSVPDTQEIDSKNVQLQPGDSPLQVVSGIADVFVVSDDGVRFPVASVEACGIIIAAAAPLNLLAVGRQGCTLASADSVSVDSAALSAFAVAVRVGLRDPNAELATDSVENLSSSISAAILSAQAAQATEWASGAVTSMSLSNSMYNSALSRLGFTSETLEDETDGLQDLPLVKVLRVVGAAEGFTIDPPKASEIRSAEDPLQLICHKSSVRYRPVTLQEGWFKSGSSSFLGVIAPFNGGKGGPVALIRGSRGYMYQRADDPRPISLDTAAIAAIAPTAFEFYAPLPLQRAVSLRDVIRLGMNGTSRLWLFAALMALGVALLGLLTPVLTNLVVGSLIPANNSMVLIQVGVALAAAAGMVFVFTLVQNFTVSLISQRSTIRMQSAFWDRVLSMPAGFFRRFNSGDLTVRVLAADTLQTLVSSQVVSAVLAATFGLVNLFLMFNYDVRLGIIGLSFLLLTTLVLFLGVRAVSRQATESLVATREANGWVVQMLSGVMKIRIANAESRAEANYLEIARRQAVAQARQTLVIGRISAWFAFASSGATALFYLAILRSWEGSPPVTAATFIAFTSSYGLAFAGIAGLSSLISPLANVGPTLNLLSPIMESLPESARDRQDPGRLTGKIELRNVKFRYAEDSPLILQGLSFTVAPGSMVALVGPSGAGKSTVTRLLLGFETPEDGQVLFDGRDLQDLDLSLVRRQMGVVVQEGSILHGSILKNIIGSVSQDIDSAWAAAEGAAFADDIRAMPMGIQTIVDPSNISGGQAQRILLARAIVNKPAIIILDEATSALDNESQAIVTKAMSDLKATRIVIAHRLSTIRSADTIIVIDKGVAVERGTYAELMALGGVFASQVSRQVV